ncbi:MAG: hypothetical protein FWC39_04700 [Bacteroidetes bacterium]|nr:hypothetical protein [Bacteroidota bacterium]
MKKTIKQIIIVCGVFLFASCSPRITITDIALSIDYQKYDKGEFITDSTTSLCIQVNENKIFTNKSFKGRVGFLYRERVSYLYDYHFIFDKIDTLYRENDTKLVLKYIENNGRHFIPQYCVLKISEANKNNIYVKFEIRDEKLPTVLKGKYKLKFCNPHPNLESHYKYYRK